jgi:hypothetical protein
MKPLCIYHGNCADGFGAAWVVNKALGGVELHPGVYGNPPPDVTGRDVILVDFSYKRPVLLEMAKAARSILVLDHHKTSADDLAGFPPPISGNWIDHLAEAGGAINNGVDPDLPRVLFDMSRSGARMAWEFFHPGQKVPHIIEIVEDRDLGGGIAFPPRTPYTRSVMTTIFSHPYDLGRWDWLANRCEDHMALQEMIAEGDAIDRKHFKDIDELLKTATRRMVIGGISVPVANLPYTQSSDAGHKLAKGEPFGACYMDTADGRVFSLRSSKEGLDVSEIARKYGGGGHRNASGFRMPIGWEGDPQ